MVNQPTLSSKELAELPLIPMSKELEALPPLPKHEEETMRILARHAIEIMLERYKNGVLKVPGNDTNVEVSR